MKKAVLTVIILGTIAIVVNTYINDHKQHSLTPEIDALIDKVQCPAFLDSPIGFKRCPAKEELIQTRRVTLKLIALCERCTAAEREQAAKQLEEAE